jgi:adenylate cyclase
MTQKTAAENHSGRPSETHVRLGLRGWIVVAALSLLIGGIVAALESKRDGFLDALNLQGYDLLVKYQRYLHKTPPSSRIFNVDFDEETVRKYNAFPIPRLLLADVIAKLASAKPAVIGVDIILDLPRLEADDKHLAKVIDDAGNVILISEYGFDHPGNEPLGDFKKAAAGVAFGDLPTDEDGSVRRMFLKITKADYKRLSLPVALADYFSDQHLRPGGPGFLLFGSRKIPLATTELDSEDSAWIHFHPSAPTTVIPVKMLLSDDFDPRVLQGKIVLVGQSSEMGKDLFTSPFTRSGATVAGRSMLSGTEIHAAATETLLSGNALRAVQPVPRVALGLALAFIVVVLAFRNRWYVAVAVCVVLAACTFLTALVLFSEAHLWLPFVSTEASLLIALPAGLGYRSIEERRLKNRMEAERGQLMGLFERYVSADVAAEIWKNKDAIVLAGEERVATILFSDIRSFTAMTCGVPSQQVLAWLNRYLTAMDEVIKENRGFLNKFIGDGIMVVFGAPLSEGPGEDACRAVRCALEMLVSIDKWNATKPAGEPSLKIGIGIHTGQVTAGNVGSPSRLEYSVIGDTVNLASRLEALTKDKGVPIVLSPATFEYIQAQFSAVSLGETPVRGFKEPIPLYTVKSKTPTEVHP